MGLVLCCIVWFSFCIVFFGSIVMLCMGKVSLFAIGILLSIGILALTWIVAFIYWLVEQKIAHAKKRLEIAATIDAKHRAIMERDLAEEKWTDALVMASMILLHIVLYGIFTPIWLVIDTFEAIGELLSKLFSKHATSA